MKDKINPQHYKATDQLEVIDIIEMFDLNFARGNVVKYVLRAGKKDEEGYSSDAKELEDLNKAIWYLQREISRIESGDGIVECG
tara:strand:+ start:1755 stop:2006 length:252 start_codon:yes stop_codon:yes gene_type:complete